MEVEVELAALALTRRNLQKEQQHHCPVSDYSSTMATLTMGKFYRSLKISRVSPRPSFLPRHCFPLSWCTILPSRPHTRISVLFGPDLVSRKKWVALWWILKLRQINQLHSRSSCPLYPALPGPCYVNWWGHIEVDGKPRMLLQWPPLECFC